MIDQGGDYLSALKGNQESLYQSAMDWVVEQMKNDFASSSVRRHAETVKGHDRVDTVEYFQLPVPTSLLGKELRKILYTSGVTVRTSRQGDKEATEVRDFVSSLRLDVKQFARSISGHWDIENSLHWCLDVTSRKDESCLRDRRAADNVAWLRRFSLSLFKQEDHKESIALRRRKAGWNVNSMMQDPGLPAI